MKKQGLLFHLIIVHNVDLAIITQQHYNLLNIAYLCHQKKQYNTINQEESPSREKGNIL